MSSAKTKAPGASRTPERLDQAPFGILEVDSSGTILASNPAAEKILGREAGELNGQSFSELTGSASRGIPGDGEETVLQLADSRGDLLVKVEVRLGRGKPKHRFLYLTDITRPTGEMERLRQLLRHSTDIHLRFELGRGCTFVSPSAEAVLGYSRDNYLKALEFERKVTHPADLHIVEEILSLLQGGGPLPERIQLRQIHRDGHIVYLDAAFSELRDPEGCLYGCEVFARDITDRTIAENRLRRREYLFSTIYQNAPVMINALDQKGRLLLWNRECENLTGWKKAELDGRTAPLSVLFPEKDAYNEFMASVWDADGSYRHWRIVRRDGEERSQEWASFPIPSGEIVSVGVDITEKEITHEELRLGERRLRQIIDLVPHFIFAKDDQGRFILVNQAVADFYETKVEELVGKTDADFGPAPQAETFLNNDREVIRSGEAQTWEEEEIFNRDGKRMVLHTTKIPFTSDQDNRKAVLGVSLDITQRKRLEQELLKSDKLESIGVLAGGIAHDFNNILAGMLGHLTLAEMQTKKNEKLSAKLGKIRGGIERAKHLTQQLLTFSRGGEPVRQPLGLGKLLREAVEFAMSGAQATFNLNVPEDLSCVLGEAGQLSQVISNLAINAVQAMPEGGRFSVEAANVTLAENEIPGLEPGNYVQIKAKDEGEGIPAEVLSSIFDPFFTTKTRGSGLGLAVAYSIIRNHHGLITADSPPDGGAVFTIYIPATPGEAVRDEALKNQTPAGGTGRILIVDDEEDIRDALKEMLEHLGYAPNCAADGRRGLTLYREALKKNQRFRAVILDLTMPGGWSGEKTAAEIRKLDPTACLISTSGYSNNSVLANHREHGFDGALSKPYSLGQLAGTLAQAIENCKRQKA